MSGFVRNRTGYILAETMLAVAILSVGLITVIRSFSSSLRGVKMLKDYHRATLLLEERIEELHTRGLGKTEGRLNNSLEGFWVEIEPMGSVPGLLMVDGLRSVRVKILWGEGENERSISLVSLVRE